MKFTYKLVRWLIEACWILTRARCELISRNYSAHAENAYCGVGSIDVDCITRLDMNSDHATKAVINILNLLGTIFKISQAVTQLYLSEPTLCIQMT